jgi:hypothetical protein
MALYPPMLPQNPIVNNIYVNGSGISTGTQPQQSTSSNPLDEKILKKIESMEQQII